MYALRALKGSRRSVALKGLTAMNGLGLRILK